MHSPSLLWGTDHSHFTVVGTHGIFFENSDRSCCFVQGFEVVIASTKGGKIPIDEVSLQEANFTEVAKAFHSSSMFPTPLHMSIATQLAFKSYVSHPFSSPDCPCAAVNAARKNFSRQICTGEAAMWWNDWRFTSCCLM